MQIFQGLLKRAHLIDHYRLISKQMVRGEVRIFEELTKNVGYCKSTKE